jgi:hypothetical protein
MTHITTLLKTGHIAAACLIFGLAAADDMDTLEALSPSQEKLQA